MVPSEKKRSAIRKSAIRCFRDAGYHASTIDEICQNAGISKGSFYWYYSSKQEVFIDILDTWTREVVDELHIQFQDALRQLDYVTAITEAVNRETHRGRSIVPLLLEFSVRSLQEPEIQIALSQFYRRIRCAIAEMLQPVLGSRLNESELHAVAATIFGAYSGLMHQDLCDPGQANARDTVSRFMSALRVWLKHEVKEIGPIENHSEESNTIGITLSNEVHPPSTVGSLLELQSPPDLASYADPNSCPPDVPTSNQEEL